jgi:hypothetical protein
MDKVRKMMDEVQEKVSKDLDFEKIAPFDEECKFGKNGLWLFIGPQGSGKTHKLLETILYTELVYDKPYFDNIIFCSTSEQLDKTLDAFKKKIKTRIEFVPEDKLLDRIKTHIKRKAKFYSMMKYIKSKGEESDATMIRLARSTSFMMLKRLVSILKRR